MKMQYLSAPGSFMKVIYILGDNTNLKIFLEPYEGTMGFIGPGFKQLPASLIVKVKYQFGISGKAFRRGNTHHVMALPQAIRIPESFQAAVCTHPCPGKYYNFLFHIILLVL
jgi:hypothetical protein